jgi:hypothetical protein
MNPQPNRVTATDLSRLTGYSPSTVSRLQTAGVLQRGGDGQYDLLSSLKRIWQHEQIRQHRGKHADRDTVPGDTIPATPEAKYHWRLRKMLPEMGAICVATDTLIKQRAELWQFLVASEAFAMSEPADTARLVGQSGKDLDKLWKALQPMLKTWKELDKRLGLGGPFTSDATTVDGVDRSRVL